MVAGSSRRIASLLHKPSSKRAFSFHCFDYKILNSVSVFWCGSPCPFLNQLPWSMRGRFWLSRPAWWVQTQTQTQNKSRERPALLGCTFQKRRRDLGPVTRKRRKRCRAGERWQDATAPRMHRCLCCCWQSGWGWPSQHTWSVWAFKCALLCILSFIEIRLQELLPRPTHKWKSTINTDPGNLGFSFLSSAKGMPNPYDSWLIQV